MERFCRSIGRALAVVAGTLMAAGLWAPPAFAQPPASAQPASAASGLQIIVTPYLWLSGIDATIKTPLTRAPQVNASAGAAEVLGDLSGVPFMGSVELRDGPFSLLGDALHVPLGVPITTRNIFFNGGSAGLTMNTGTAVLLYRVLDQPLQSLDAGAGFRAWAFYSDLTLTGRRLPTASVSGNLGWADPLIAVRYHRELGRGFGVSAYGDVGGFGVAAHIDWLLIGTIDYTPNPGVTLRLG